ncbi:hypothetical protein LINGRAHAP2_LOCUS8077 [Linum grandiflorum]
MLAIIQELKEKREDRKKADATIGINFSESRNNKEVHNASATTDLLNRGNGVCVDDYFASRTNLGDQPGIKSALASKDVIHVAHLLIAKWFYDCCIPFHATKSPYFQQAFTAACAIRSGFKIVRPGATRFATHFITLNSVYEHKFDLQSLVVSEFFNSNEAGKSKKGQNVSAIILDAHFWYECLEVVKVETPVINLLRIVDSDERPTLGYVYEGMRKVIQGIKAIYNDIEAMYKPYIDIMNKRWNKHFRGDLHVAAYYFNPALKYATKENVMPYLLNLFEKKQICSDPMAAIKEMEIYEEAKGSFGRELAIRGRAEFNPGNLSYLLF